MPTKSKKNVPLPRPIRLPETATGCKWRTVKNTTHLFRYGNSICSNMSMGPVETDDVYAPVCTRCLKLAAAGDFIEKNWNEHTGTRQYNFPTVAVHGTGCGHISSFFWRRDVELKEVRDDVPQLAFQIALLKHGYDSMVRWDNAPPEHACDCDRILKEMGNPLENIGILEDSGWTGRNGGRCITDYTRKIVFKKNLTPDEERLVVNFLTRKDCPGWTGVHQRQLYGNTYMYTTTMDSSD